MAYKDDLLADLEDYPEVQDVLVAFGKVGVEAANALKDGAQISDLLTIAGSSLGELGEAVDGIGQVDDEIAKFQVDDAAVVGQLVLEYIKEMHAAYKA